MTERRPSASDAPVSRSSPAPLLRDFVRGESTSSYRIEGAAGGDGRGGSIWDRFCRQRGRIENGDLGDVACDRYHRYADEIALMCKIGVDVHRFSLSWPPVLPRGCGNVNEAGLVFYDCLIDALLAACIEPWLCFRRWTAVHPNQGFGLPVCRPERCDARSTRSISLGCVGPNGTRRR